MNACMKKICYFQGAFNSEIQSKQPFVFAIEQILFFKDAICSHFPHIFDPNHVKSKFHANYI